MPLVNGGDLFNFLRHQGETWILTQQAIHRPNGRRLTLPEHGQLAAYFPHDILERVRIVNVPVIENPDFYAALAAQGVTIPMDFTQMSGITFVDTIALSAAHAPPPSDMMALLFHELVHVLQFRILGVSEFLRQYVDGWVANGFEYESIPLERWAYELDARFRAGGGVFDVGAIVTTQLSGSK